MKTLFSLFFLTMVLSLAAHANPFPSNKLKFGDGAASDKTLEFNKGSATNPKLLFKNSDSSFQMNQNILRFGSGAAADKTLEADQGLGSTNPKLKYNNTTSAWQFSNDGSSFTDIGAGGSSGTTASELTNLAFAASVSANAMTIALKGKNLSDPSGSNIVKLSFRDLTATNGTFEQVSVTSALSIVIPSSATLGHVSAAAEWVWLYAINNSGTVELAVSGSKIADEGALVSTTTISAGATSRYVLYSTTGRTSKPIRLIGRILSTQATAGTWASAPTVLSTNPFFDQHLVNQSSTPVRVEFARLTLSASCVILSQSGNWINNLNTCSTGRATVAFQTGLWSAAPSCICMSEGGTAGRFCIGNGAPTTSAITIIHHDSGTPTDTNVTFMCYGQR